MTLGTDPAATSVDRRNVRLTVAYDGTDFHGFAANVDVRTVMGELSAAVARVVRAEVELTGAGRTDAGVHGWGQVVTGLIPGATDLRRLMRSLNGLCGPEIAVRSAEWAAPEFSARFSATARSYRYDIWNHPEPNPLVARASWHVPAPLDVDSMGEAAGAFIGEHDFSAFCRRPKSPTSEGGGSGGPSLVRRVTHAGWSLVDSAWGDVTRFEITATSFCHQMVRSIVGTLVEVGQGKRAVDSIAPTLASRDRAAAGPVAPPHGLVLWEVDYRDTRWNV